VRFADENLEGGTVAWLFSNQYLNSIEEGMATSSYHTTAGRSIYSHVPVDLLFSTTNPSEFIFAFDINNHYQSTFA